MLQRLLLKVDSYMDGILHEPMIEWEYSIR